MKKRYKILIILAALIVLLMAALKIVPSIAKSYVVSHSEEWIGRKMQIASVDFNPATFTVTVDTFAIFEADGTTPFVSFEKFRLNLNPTRLLSKEINVSEIYLKGLYTNVVQNADRFNFSDILDKLSSSEQAPDSVNKISPNEDTPKADTAKADSVKAINLNPTELTGGFDIVAENIVLEKGNIIYRDEKIGSKFHIQDFSIDIPAVYFNNQDTDIGITMGFADGGDLKVKVLFNMETQGFNVSVELNQFALSCIKPYLRDFINYKDFSGTLNVHVNVEGNVNEVLSSNISGNINLSQVVLTETSGKSMGLNNVDVGIAKANLNEMNFKVDSVIVDGAFAHLDLMKGGRNNIDVLLNSKKDTTALTGTEEPTESTSAPKEKPLKFAVNKFQVKNTKVSANDFTLSKPFAYTVSNVSVNGSNINFNSPCAINVSANFPEGGVLSLKYKGALSDIGNTDIYISVKNLALKHFTPYSHHFTGYPISSGTLAFASENKLTNWDINSKNTIDIYNIDVADKDPNATPEFSVPMKIGLYILKDKDDKIQFDIPVSGNVKDPEFSYGKIIWKTVMNLLVKVALSPFKLVGNLAASGASAMGIDLGGNDEIVIDPLSNNLESEQYAKAIKMVETINKDPKLKLNFVQSYPLKKTVEAYKIRKQKTQYYMATSGKKTLNELDEKSIIEIDDKDSLFVAYTQTHTEGLDRRTLEKELLELSNKRNQDLLKTLQQQKGVNKKNLTITTAPRAELAKFRGKPTYKVQLDVQ